MTLSAEVRPVELPRLRGRESRCVECLHDFVGELPLIIRKHRRWAPRQTRANILVDSRLRACGRVRAPMQIPHLFEQRLEQLLVHDERTLLRLAAEAAECLHEPLARAPLVLQEQDATKLSEPGRWIVERPENALAVFDRQGEDQDLRIERLLEHTRRRLVDEVCQPRDEGLG